MPSGRARKTNFGASRGIKNEGALTSLGYRLHEASYKRHQAIEKSVEKDGYKTTMERLNALAVLNKGNTTNHSTLEYDMNWLRDAAYTREPSKDTAGGPAFVNKAGTKTYHDKIPDTGFRVFKE